MCFVFVFLAHSPPPSVFPPPLFRSDAPQVRRILGALFKRSAAEVQRLKRAAADTLTRMRGPDATRGVWARRYREGAEN